MKKNIVLVFPRFKYPSGDISLGLAYLAAYIRENIKDLNLSILDATFNPTLEYAKNFLERKKPEIVGIFSDTLMFNDALKVARIAKSLNCNVIFGGPHPTVLPDSAIKEDSVDAVCIGEGEETFKDYIEAFYKKADLKKVRGIYFKKNGKVIKNPPRMHIENLDILPIPAYDLFDIGKYIKKFS